MSYERRDYGGGAVASALNGAITSGQDSATLTVVTGWPDGNPGPFYATIDPGLPTEERVLVTSRTSTSLIGMTRGVDGTSASAHEDGAVVVHGFTATEADEANFVVSKTVGQVTTKGDLLAATGSQALGVRSAGVNGYPLVARSSESTGLAYEQLAAGGIASDAVTTAKILDANVTTAKIAADAIDGTKIADDAIDSEHIADGAIDPAHLADNAVTNAKVANDAIDTAEIVDDAVTTAKIADANVTAAKLEASLPRGEIGYGERTSDVGPTAVLADITSVNDTVTTVAGDKLKITVYARAENTSAVGGTKIYIREGTDVINSGTVWSTDANTSAGFTLTARVEPTAGSHTYKASFENVSAGTSTIKADADEKCFIIIEHIGGA